MDIQMLEQQLQGLEAKGKDLREKESRFLKAQGLEEQAEKARMELSEIEADLQDIKEKLSELKTKKREAVKNSIKELQLRIDEVLPEGKAVIDIEDRFFIGWEVNGQVKPAASLSGGEKVVFEGALINALGAEVLIYEAAEADGGRLESLLERLAGSEKQVIVNAWFKPKRIPESFNVVEL